jgi:3-methyladenine DNA glycosylase Mpg
MNLRTPPKSEVLFNPGFNILIFFEHLVCTQVRTGDQGFNEGITLRGSYWDT